MVKSRNLGVRRVRVLSRALLRRALHSIVSLHGSSEAIALGAAVGVFVAFTPTVGLQMLLAALLATLVGANRPAAVIPPWITNPVTIPPIFGLAYWLGSFFRSGPAPAEVYQRLGALARSLGELSWYAFHHRLTEFLKVGAEVFVPMLIGGVILGTFFGAITYPVMLWAVRRYRRRRARRRERRALRRAKHEPAGQGGESPPESGTPSAD